MADKLTTFLDTVATMRLDGECEECGAIYAAQAIEVCTKATPDSDVLGCCTRYKAEWCVRSGIVTPEETAGVQTYSHFDNWAGQCQRVAGCPKGQGPNDGD